MSGLVWTPELHAYCEWLYDLGYEQGYAAGLRDASAAMDTAMTEALEGSSYGLGPANPTAAETVRRLARTMTSAVTQ